MDHDGTRSSNSKLRQLLHSGVRQRRVITFVDAADKHGFPHPNIITPKPAAASPPTTPCLSSKCSRRPPCPK